MSSDSREEKMAASPKPK